jgi:hypothetical protein
VPGNIAEDQARYSLVEIETQLLVAKDLGGNTANDAEFVFKSRHRGRAHYPECRMCITSPSFTM